MTVEDILKNIYNQGLTGGQDENFQYYVNILMHYGVLESYAYDTLYLGYSNAELHSYGVHVPYPDFSKDLPESTLSLQAI